MDDSNLKNRVVTRAPDVGFEDLHKAHPKVLKVGPDLPPSGGSDGVESVFVRCQQCGMVLDSSKTSPGNPYGNISAVDCVITADDGTKSVSTKAKDSQIGAGCPFCGSSEY